jgi:hypothetical protein
MGLLQALSEYTFRPAEDAEEEIREPEPLEPDAELEEPVDAETDPLVAAGKLLPAWEPEVPIMALPFIVFK